MASYQFTKHDPDSYRADPLFKLDKAHNGLTVNIPAHASHVVTVTDGPSQWEQVAELAGTQFLGHVPGVALAARSAYIRSSLRPASQGSGRDRFR